jgi:hypothetical protein
MPFSKKAEKHLNELCREQTLGKSVDYADREIPQKISSMIVQMKK